MRVIAGSQKGRILAGPKSAKIRPALDKVKQAIFNILGDVEGLQVLDLFAGTGSIGIEALSRGAHFAVFADSEPEALRLIRENLKRTDFEKQARILKLRLPFRRFTDPPFPFDLIFVDPPYDRNLVNPTLRAIAREKILAPRGTVVVEHSPREPIEEDVGLAIIDRRKYGQTLISFLKG
jgi:16S rRNA (guanine(966)-N(2))-methyltransferase RsmD